jgi:hypothetical protein
MLVLVLGVAVTAVLVATAGYHARLRAADMGSMSDHWLASYNASRPSASQ